MRMEWGCIQSKVGLGFSGVIGYGETLTNMSILVTRKHARHPLSMQTRRKVAHTYLNQPWFQVGVNNDVISVCRIMMMSYLHVE